MGFLGEGQQPDRTRAGSVRFPSNGYPKSHPGSPCFMGNFTISMVIVHSYVEFSLSVTEVNHQVYKSGWWLTYFSEK